MLTKEDLAKIAELFNVLKCELITEFRDEFVTKKEFFELKDDVADLKDMVMGIRNELNAEHEVRHKLLRETAALAKLNRRDIDSMMAGAYVGA